MSKTSIQGLGKDSEEEEDNSVEEEQSDGNRAVTALVGASEMTGGPTLAQYNQLFSHKSYPSLLAIIKPITKIMAKLQAACEP
ncbi:hypothetical protein O181_123768 [Austropuccinia psidii MF-1]|uniref:Uncharacterized protein n=1 Tax=Austropuccinia psidii MF-1 TaxID=1389203 RepID=A0A9Q3KLR7_9BASI|nr:hypothetical protein [Austropuccinia psidii MF-1]